MCGIGAEARRDHRYRLVRERAFRIVLTIMGRSKTIPASCPAKRREFAEERCCTHSLTLLRSDRHCALVIMRALQNGRERTVQFLCGAIEGFFPRCAIVGNDDGRMPNETRLDKASLVSVSAV
jgi:hypothetical protein